MASIPTDLEVVVVGKRVGVNCPKTPREKSMAGVELFFVVGELTVCAGAD
jgi:hypothetical protein